MGTKLNEYLQDEGRPKNARSAARRAAFAQAYGLAADLIELRLGIGLTQQDLAARCGIAQSEISRIERGVVHPTDTTWVRLAEALGADVRIVARSERVSPRSSTRRPRTRAAAGAATS